MAELRRSRAREHVHSPFTPAQTSRGDEMAASRHRARRRGVALYPASADEDRGPPVRTGAGSMDTSVKE
jgi:hypothetical protein